MFESLQQMAKMLDTQDKQDGGESKEDKGVLNFHIILIGSSSSSRLIDIRDDLNLFSINREYALLRC